MQAEKGDSADLGSPPAACVLLRASGEWESDATCGRPPPGMHCVAGKAARSVCIGGARKQRQAPGLLQSPCSTNTPYVLGNADRDETSPRAAPSGLRGVPGAALTVSTGKSCSFITGSLQTLPSQQLRDPGHLLRFVPPPALQQRGLRGASSVSYSRDGQYIPAPSSRRSRPYKPHSQVQSQVVTTESRTLHPQIHHPSAGLS